MLAALDRTCFSEPLPADDLCGYLVSTNADSSGSLFRATDRGPHETEIALLLSTFDGAARLKPVGFLLLVIRDELAVISRLGICPKERGQGLGRLFLDRVRTETRPLGVTVWAAEVSLGDQASQEFFSRLGFLHACPTAKYLFAPQELSTIVLWHGNE